MYRYRLFGANVTSDIKLDLPWHRIENHADKTEKRGGNIDIRSGSVPRLKKGSSKSAVFITEDSILYEIDNNYRYKIKRNGNITYAYNKSETESFLVSGLVSLALPAYNIYRDILMMHASSVLTNNGVVLFAGPSGVGKSTIATFCHIHGLQVIGDDIAPIVVKDNNIYLADTIMGLRIMDDGPFSSFVTSDKKKNYYIIRGKYGKTTYQPVSPIDDRESRLWKVSRVFFLHKGRDWYVDQLNGAGSISTILKNLYLRKTTELVWGQEKLLKTARQIASCNVVLASLQSTRTSKSLNKILNLLENGS